MTEDPPRLLNSDLSAWQRELLTVAQGDGLSEGEAKRIGLAVGVGAAGGIAALSSPGPSVAAQTKMVSGLSAQAQVLIKWALVGGGAAAAVGAALLFQRAESTEPAEAHPAQVVVVAAEGKSHSEARPEEPRPVAAEPTVGEPQAAAETPPARVASSPAGTTSTLREELALLDAARSALARGQPSQCLELLRKYQLNYARGVLREEASVLRIEALFRQGAVGDARRAAEAFLKASNKSPQRARVESLLARTK